MPADLDTYKLNKIFTAPVGDLSAEQQELMNEIKANKTTPRDPRFPTQNQANHCWNRYNEWLVCLKSTQDEAGCKPLRFQALKICPTIWSEKWDEEREEGTFSGIKTE
jgi:cytochrome c oxidase subunit 6b